MTCNPYGTSLFTDFYNGNDPVRAMQLVEERLAADFVDHAAAFGASPDKAGFAATVGLINTAFKQCYIVERLIEQDQTVVAIWTAEVSHVGTFMGVEPTGRTFQLQGITAYELRDGLIVRHWEKFDVVTILTTLGIIPSLGG